MQNASGRKPLRRPVSRRASAAASRLPDQFSPLGLYLATLVSVCLAGLALLADLPVARFCLDNRVPGDVRRLLTWSEVFAHGLGVGVIVLLVIVLDRACWRFVPRMLAVAYGSGLLANVLKLVVARTRPHHFTLDGSVTDTFVAWFPFVGSAVDTTFDHSLQSFPSAHTATAVGLAIGLSRLYSRGRWLFLCFACLAAGQRIDVGAHYVSDTLAGAAVGCLLAAIISDRRLLGRWFDAWETRPSRVGSR